MRAYSDPLRQTDKWSIPNVEIFFSDEQVDADGEKLDPGWFYWFCLPGCLPDSDPFGPYSTADAALAAAQDYDA